MVIHAVWDFGIFTHGADAVSGSTGTLDGSAGQSLQLLLVLVGVIVFVVMARKLFSGTSSAETRDMTPL